MACSDRARSAAVKVAGFQPATLRWLPNPAAEYSPAFGNGADAGVDDHGVELDEAAAGGRRIEVGQERPLLHRFRARLRHLQRVEPGLRLADALLLLPLRLDMCLGPGTRVSSPASFALRAKARPGVAGASADAAAKDHRPLPVVICVPPNTCPRGEPARARGRLPIRLW